MSHLEDSKMQFFTKRLHRAERWVDGGRQPEAGGRLRALFAGAGTELSRVVLSWNKHR